MREFLRGAFTPPPATVFAWGDLVVISFLLVVGTAAFVFGVCGVR